MRMDYWIHLSSPLPNGRGDVLLFEKERPLWKLWKRGWPSSPSSSGRAPRWQPSMNCCTSTHIIGRMGVPYREKGVNIISVAMDAPGDVISALSGKLGRLEGVIAKTVYAPAGSV